MNRQDSRLHAALISGTFLTATAFSSSMFSTVAAAQVLEEVIVTARKRAEAMQDVPVSVTAFTGNQLRNAGIVNLKDLGYQTPGLQIDQSSAAQIWIRGIGQRDDGSRVDAPVGVYIDGLYIPRKDGQLLDLLDTQSIQVLRGPQGTLFGKNTTAGAIVITTNGPEADFGGFVDVRVGNYDRQDLKATVSVPLIDQTLLSKITLGSISREGYQRNINTGQRAASEDRKSAALQLTWLPSDSFSMDALAYYGKTDEVQPTTNCRFMVGSSFNGEDSLFGNRIFPGDTVPVDAYDDNDTPLREGHVAQSPILEAGCARSNAQNKDYRSISEHRINFELDNLLLGLTLEWEISNDLSFKSITGYGDQEKSGNFGNPDNDVTDEVISARYRVGDTSSKRKHLSQEFQLNGTAFDDRFTYTAGLFAMKEDIDDGTDTSSGSPSGSLLYVPQPLMLINDPSTERQTYDLENTTYAVFFQGSYDLTDNLELTAGLRWTSEKREQTVDLEFLDQAAFRDIAFAAIEGVPGIVPIKASGIGLVTDLDALIAADIFSLIAAEFPRDANDQFVYDLVPARELVPDIDEDASETWKEITPMVSLAYHLPDNLLRDSGVDAAMFYASYGEGFKSGTFEPIGVDGQQTVEPELVENYEFGFKLDFLDARMRLNGAAFRTNFDNMQLRQVLLDSGGTPRVVLNNASKTRIVGGELEWSWLPTDNLLLVATASYNDYKYLDFEEQQFSSKALFTQVPLPVVDRSGETFAEVPESTFSLGVQYTWESSWGTFVPRIDYSYVDEIFMGLDAGSGQNPDQSTFDDYGLVNARLGWSSPEGRFEGALYVTNLTDEFYYMGAAAVGDSTGTFQTTSGLPRMYGMELRYSFE
ncbi:TonB-dependent receptor [Halieaceae bacterium IMCC8485]|uniref:TonB-dependent receptor n=1 Tax=Candidatus Seongchinamella marina TaxID=2518990 RepID=A0ABT3SVV1_9GAMM|nr:TonB-dependent receptor [Candidatus Seongchinamella marina]MCX2974122.1 TonB-dependent receptor [Candidatus Seongchinamella marina]